MQEESASRPSSPPTPSPHTATAHPAPAKPDAPGSAAQGQAGQQEPAGRTPGWRRPVSRLALVAVILGSIIMVSPLVPALHNLDTACKPGDALRQQIDRASTGEMAAFRSAATGFDARGLRFIDTSDRQVTIADFSGKVLLVNLWATWCAPCRHEMPTLDALAADMNSDSFAVVTINLDTGPPDRAAAFLDEIAARNLPLFRDPHMAVFNDLRARGRVFGLPATFLIDARGCEIGILNGPADWASSDARALIAGSLSRS